MGLSLRRISFEGDDGVKGIKLLDIIMQSAQSQKNRYVSINGKHQTNITTTNAGKNDEFFEILRKRMVEAIKTISIYLEINCLLDLIRRLLRSFNK